MKKFELDKEIVNLYDLIDLNDGVLGYHININNKDCELNISAHNLTIKALTSRKSTSVKDSTGKPIYKGCLESVKYDGNKDAVSTNFHMMLFV